MLLRIEIKTEGAAVADYGAHEIARMVRDVADKIENTSCGSGAILDINGNRVGFWALALPDEDD